MNHHDDVGAGGESARIAGLLVSTIAAVDFVNLHRQPQAVRDLHGGVTALVVDQDALVDRVWQLPNCCFEGLCGVKGRHHDDDAFSVDHLVPRTRSLYVNAWPGNRVSIMLSLW